MATTLRKALPFSSKVLSGVAGKPFNGMRIGSFLAAISLCFSPLVWADATMTMLDDSSLGEVAAQQGIAFDLEYRINSLANGDPVSTAECPTVGVLTGGASCRIAYSLADSSGMWIVAKGYRGTIKLTNIRIDAVTLAAAWTSRTSGTATGAGGQAAFMNPNLCINAAGCISTSAASNYYDPRSKPSFQLAAGNWATAMAAGSAAYNTYLNQPNYTDFTASLYVDRLTGEFDTGCTTSTGNTTCTTKEGYLQNNVPGAPIALRLSSGGLNSNVPANIRLDGRLQIYGFGY
ncbi:MAG: hypothetical protein ACRERR_10325 [Moraxellaceae bacterium]